MSEGAGEWVSKGAREGERERDLVWKHMSIGLLSTMPVKSPLCTRLRVPSLSLSCTADRNGGEIQLSEKSHDVKQFFAHLHI